MKFLFLLLTTLLLCTNIQAQSDSSHKYIDDGVYTFVSTMPVFSGGDDLKFVQYVVSYVRKNTPQPKDSAITGKVFVQFAVEIDSSVSAVAIAPGKGINPAIDQAVIDAVKKSQWTPGTINGKATRVKRTIPIKFY